MCHLFKKFFFSLIDNVLYFESFDLKEHLL